MPSLLGVLLLVLREITSLTRKVATLSENQDKLNADVVALSTSFDGIEAEVAALKAQIAAGTPPEALDFTALDALVARGQADVPAPPSV